MSNKLYIYGAKYINRAESLLEYSDESSIRYAVLELRMFIESFFYKTLKCYKQYILPEYIKNWQSQKIVDFMTEFDPYYDKGKSLTLISGSGKGLKLKDSKMLDKKFLNKHYHKLGSYLHASRNNSSVNWNKVKDDLLKLCSDLKEYDANIHYNLSKKVAYNCEYCEIEICITERALFEGKEISCLNPDCRAIYTCKKENDVWYFNPKYSLLKCECGNDIKVSDYSLNKSSSVIANCDKWVV